MDRARLVRSLVLDSTADDYENVDQVILRDVSKMCARFGFTVERSEVVDALAGLIRDGLAKAYRLSPFEDGTELDGMPDISVAEKSFRIYFYITPKGREVHEADDFYWPSDDDGNPLPANGPR